MPLILHNFFRFAMHIPRSVKMREKPARPKFPKIWKRAALPLFGWFSWCRNASWSDRHVRPYLPVSDGRSRTAATWNKFRPWAHPLRNRSWRSRRKHSARCTRHRPDGYPSSFVSPLIVFAWRRAISRPPAALAHTRPTGEATRTDDIISHPRCEMQALFLRKHRVFGF